MSGRRNLGVKNGPAQGGDLGRSTNLNGVRPAEFATSAAKNQENLPDFAASWVASRYRLPLPVARVIAALASLGERLS